MSKTLPDIPVIKNVCTQRDLVDMHPAHIDDMLRVCYRLYTKAGLTVADLKSKRWVNTVKPPYSEDLHHIAKKIGRNGVYTLNLSYEWGCTTTAIDRTAQGEGVKLFRSMDWPINGMADKVVVAKHAGSAGEYWNITYPGFIGVLQGMAPGRFSIAINQAPVLKKTPSFAVDWVLARNAMYQSTNMPAPFLLRKVFEEAATFDQAVEMLSKTPIAVPALFTVAGVNPGEHAIIERLPNKAYVHRDQVCVANHWLNKEWKGHDRPPFSRQRQETGTREAKNFQGDFDWLKHPILNHETRLAFEADAKTGTLKVRGMEGPTSVTKVLVL